MTTADAFSINRFWYIKLYALTESRDFEGLEGFAKSKRSPIGYEAFVHHLVEKGYPKEAVPYVSKCDSPKRADLFAKCGEWRLAGNECKERNDKAKLEYVYNAFHPVTSAHFVSSNSELRKRAPNSMIARELDQIAATMK